MSVRIEPVDPQHIGQRIDNYLRHLLPGVPKSHVYRILRKGEVRVNKKRIKPEYRLQDGDVLRIPPVSIADKSTPAPLSKAMARQLSQAVLYEDDQVLVLNKPAGWAVHGGSGVHLGLIEALRQWRPKQAFLELVHRLDRETSGCLVVAKRRQALLSLHELIRENQVDKRYWLLSYGQWPKSARWVNAPLKKNLLRSGERFVRVDSSGKVALTEFHLLQTFEQMSFLEARLHTGRTHQIRVHCQHQGHAIVGDSKYATPEALRQGKERGWPSRLFLHAHSIAWTWPESDEQIQVSAPLDDAFIQMGVPHASGL